MKKYQSCQLKARDRARAPLHAPRKFKEHFLSRTSIHALLCYIKKYYLNVKINNFQPWSRLTS